MRTVVERVPMFGLTIIWDRDHEGLLIGIALPFYLWWVLYLRTER